MVHYIMLRTFRHRGLKRLFQRGDLSGVSAEHLIRIEDVLAHLDVATKARDLHLPGYRLHALKGKLKGSWSVTISGNWRVVFRMEDGDVFDLDLVDYH